VVPELADWAFVELVREDGRRIERVGMAHRDPGRERWVRELDRRFPLDPDATVGSPNVIRTGKAEFMPDIPDEMLEQAATDEEHLAVLREVGFTSALITPLVARGRVLGCLSLATDADSGRHIRPETLPVVQALADRCALGLDNASLYEQRKLAALASRASCCRATCRPSRASTSPSATRPPGRATTSGATSTTCSRRATAGSWRSATSSARARPRRR
jgi:GAF domain-containing protein